MSHVSLRQDRVHPVRVKKRNRISALIGKPGEMPFVEAIPAFANIVIGNILKNTVKYTERDVISVYLTATGVLIQDYGPGIEVSVQNTLSGRFNRGEKRNFDGSGIGLALVRRFSHQYGWAIDFYSEMNKGARIAVIC